MHPTKLYVIGNGFDLWHDIKSKYEHFKKYVRCRDKDLFYAVDRYLPVNENWCDLESALAEVDVNSIIDNFSHFAMPYGSGDWSDSGHHDFQDEVDNVVQHLSSKLQDRFGEWVGTLVIPTPGTASKRLREIDGEAAFLTFNYTSTLKSLYDVPDAQVLHIHGQAELQNSELILGHAWNPSQHRSLNDRPDIEDMDTRLVEANDILDRYFSSTFKPSAHLIRTHQKFFDQLDAITTVQVLGHSLSKEDQPYFRELLRNPCVAAALWRIACRSEEEKEKKLARLKEMGVDIQRVEFVYWTDM